MTHSPSQQGFTLLEMLVAFSILSLAALTLIRLDAFAVRTAGAVDGSALARIVAANVAADILTAPLPPAAGQASSNVSNGGRNWSVRTSVAPGDDAAVLRIDIRVAGGGDSAVLSVLRAAEGNP